MLAFEFFDDTIKTTSEVAQTTGVPLLGAIARHKALSGAGRERLIVQALPESRAAENYRVLGTKLLFSNGAAGRLRSALLSSAQMSEDTGEIAANLAVVLAQTGSRVVLVDANLYNPSIGQLFGIADRLGGLTDVLTRQAKTPKLTAVDWAPGLSVLPSGPVSYDSFSLLSSSRMVELLEQLEGQADIVIITASPLLSFADSLILASRVDGVVLLARSGKTRRDVINDVIKNLRSLNAHVVGTVFDYNRSIFWPSFTRRKARQVLPFPSDRQLSDEDALAGQSESLNLGKTS
jgi:non-specific protein-tyrosine kinase